MSTATKKSAEKVANDATETPVEIKTPAAKQVKPKLLSIRLDKLHPFENHPYKVLDDDSMTELKNSIACHDGISIFLNDDGGISIDYQPHDTVAKELVNRAIKQYNNLDITDKDNVELLLLIANLIKKQSLH